MGGDTGARYAEEHPLLRAAPCRSVQVHRLAAAIGEMTMSSLQEAEMVRSTARAWAAHTARTVRAAAVVCGLVWLSALLSGQSPAADVIEPVVRITSPAEDATVSGTVTIVAEATDEGGIAGVTF